MAGYDLIAEEYYDDKHITSRNFDQTTKEFISAHDISVPGSGTIIDLGAGCGRVSEYFGVVPERIIQLDASQRMLTLDTREPSYGRICGDALSLPLKSGIASAITAFLYDPYNCSELYDEIARVLDTDGVFIGTLPHYEWGQSLREVANFEMDETVFVTDSDGAVKCSSNLMSEQELIGALRTAGLTKTRLDDVTLPLDVVEVSDHVKIPANRRGLHPSDLPIVQFIRAAKR